MNTDSVARKREEEKEEKAKDPMARRETINLLKRDSKDTHVLGEIKFFFLCFLLKILFKIPSSFSPSFEGS